MIIESIFPTPVAVFNFGREFTEDELAFVANQTTHNNTGNTTSNNRSVLKAHTMTGVREFVEESLLEYFKTVHSPKFDVAPYITQSWLNYTAPGQFHHKHAHPNSIISGVFYINADKDLDKIYFFKEHYEQIKLLPGEWNLWNSDSWWLPAETGKLLLFPSKLVHMVETKVGNNVRTSLAFNTFLKGYVGQDESLTGLHLGG